MSIDEKSILLGNVKKSKIPSISIIFMGLIIIGMAVVLIIDANNKDQQYKTTAGTVNSTQKQYEAGKPYYKVRYQYTVNKKTYYYSDPKKYFDGYDEVITIKYNKDNPNEIYISSYFIYFIVLGGIGIIVLIIGIIKLASVTYKNSQKIIVGQIYDELTCIGGKKFFIKSLDESFNPLPPEKTEYFSYFTNDYNHFKRERKVKFNVYKYSETTMIDDSVRDKIVININDLKINDFIFYE